MPDAGGASQTPRDPVELSEQYLRGRRSGESSIRIRDEIATIDEDRLAALEQPERLAFWINVYNATAHAALEHRPERFENRRRFFAAPLVTVAGTSLSLDEIEHGILRRSKWKYGLGYIPHPFPSSFERRHRLSALDNRIHFVLNCGAASCPAIAAYTAESIDEQLDLAASQYLSDEVVFSGETVYLPRLLLWFRGDFDGRSGIQRLLRRYDIIDQEARPRIRYKKYDWSLDLDNFRGEDPS